MLNQRINSFWDFGSSISVAATAMTQAVNARRLIEVLGSSDSTTVATIQPPNRTNAAASAGSPGPRMLSRIASAIVSTAMPPNAA